MRTLKINLLYECTAKCAHCRFHCTNEREVKTPDFETPYRVARELKDLFGLDMAVVLGGEPTIFRWETTELLRRLSTLGIATRLETNASWAGTFGEAVDFLAPLKALNTHVMFSLDGFHDPFVTLQNIVNAVNAAASLPISFNLEIPYLDYEARDNTADRRTGELYKALKEQTDVAIPCYEGGIVFTGRAAESFGGQFAAGRGVPHEACTSVPWWMDSAIDSTELLILEPGGYITKGCGIAIGNVFEQNLEEMIGGFDAKAHPIFSVLLKEGPLGLAKMAERVGYRLKSDYADKCHLCYEARQALKPYYSQFLQPDQHYPASIV